MADDTTIWGTIKSAIKAELDRLRLVFKLMFIGIAISLFALWAFVMMFVFGRIQETGIPRGLIEGIAVTNVIIFDVGSGFLVASMVVLVWKSFTDVRTIVSPDPK